MKDNVLKAFVNAGAPKRPGDIAKELGMDCKEVSKCIDALKKEGGFVSLTRRFYAPA